ncbi:hypothetical protein GCM10009616_28680 [Microlunatus lacustris]
MARGGLGQEAEDYVVEQVRLLPGWAADNANESRVNQPGFDVLACHAGGRQLRVSVKSVSKGGVRQDYSIGRSFERHPADVYTFVDMTGDSPGPVYLAGARTVEALARERHHKYQADRGRAHPLNSWAPKVSRRLLETMDAREAWELLNHPAPESFPQVTEALRRLARADAPRPRGGSPRLGARAAVDVHTGVLEN